MPRPRRIVLLFVLAAAAAADDAREEWAVLQFGGKDAGFVHTVARVLGDGSVETTVRTRMSIRRLDAAITVEQSERTLEDARGRLRRIDASVRLSGQETVTEVRFEEGKAVVTTRVLGSARDSAVDCPEVYGLAHVERLTRQAVAAKDGVPVKVWTFLPDLGGPVELEIRALGEEETALRGGSRARLTRVETRMGTTPLKPVSWIDGEGRHWKTSIPMMGMAIELHRATRGEALAAAAAGAPPDLFRDSLLAAPHPVPLPRRVERARLRIRPRPGAGDLPELDGVVAREEEGALLLDARRRVPEAGRTGARPLADPPAELAPFLAPNSMVQSDAPEIAALAAEVAGGEGEAWKAAQALERWVDRNIREKGLDVGFASALEVCRTRKGDCSEHAVFLCALCRAAGIPARVVMGLVYFGSVWAGHAWNEVWIDGAWYALDATTGYGFVDPLHVALARASLEDGAFGAEFLGVVMALGAIDIDVLEVEVGGRRLRPGDAAATEVDGRRYRDLHWRLAFTAPEGYEPDRDGRASGISLRLLELDGRTAKGAKVEIEIDAWDAPPAADWTAILDRYRGVPAVETTVDGRDARRFTRTDGGRRRDVVFVLREDACFRFEIDRVEGPAEEEAFAAFLASVDLGNAR